MALYLLDTDTLTLHQHNHPVVRARVHAHAPAAGHMVGLTAAGVEEQVTGWLASLRRARVPAEHAKASWFGCRLVASWAGFPVSPLTEAGVAIHLRLQGLRLNIGPFDLKIAAIALDAGATLVTRNRRDFARVPNLTLADWSV